MLSGDICENGYNIMSMRNPVIGLEIHAELLTDSKLFCGCKNDPNSEKPNTYICPVCMGYPGAVPYINKKAIESMLKIGTALNGELADFTEFDRKHYFYPDIPKGYQISQYKYPLVKNASLNGVDITRIHLEEDTAKSFHDTGDESSLIDFNRSGVPLMELVTEPVIKSSKEARKFAEELQLVLRYLSVARARMELGEMRIEANISLSNDDGSFGTKVEIKNLNSFKSVGGAIEYEIKRQGGVLDSGKKVIQETMGWNENTLKTFSQRIKENADEYRYMPDPDLPKFYISKIKEFDIKKSDIPQLPKDLRLKYEGLSIDKKIIEIIIGDVRMAKIFNEAIDGIDVDVVKNVANLLTTDVLGHLESVGDKLFENVTGSALREVAKMQKTGDISSRGAKNIIAILVVEGGNPVDIAKDKGLFQMTDSEDLKKIVKEVIKNNEEVIKEYRSGKESSFKYLIGSVMKATKGSGNPQMIQEILKELL